MLGYILNGLKVYNVSILERIYSYLFDLVNQKKTKTINSYSVTSTNPYLAGDKENSGKLCFLVSYQVFDKNLTYCTF